MRRRVNYIQEMDWLTVLLYLLMVGFGLVNIYSSAYNSELPSLFETSQRYGKQILWIGAALVFAIVIFLIDSRFYSFIAYPFYLLMMVVLVFIIFFGIEVNAAKSWIEIGSFRIQPAEFGKLAVGLALAKYLSSISLNAYTPATFVRIGAIVFIPMLLVLMQNDTGSALVYFSFIMVLYREGLSANFLWIGLASVFLFVMSFMVPIFFLALGIIVAAYLYMLITPKLIKTKWVVGLVVIGAFFLAYYGQSFLDLNFTAYFWLVSLSIGGALVLLGYGWWYRVKRFVQGSLVLIFSLLFVSSVDFVFNEVLEAHQQNRILVLLGKKSDPQGVEWNVIQSKIAIGSGGLAGKGFLNGTQTKFDFVPEQSTDFIFCTVGEEWGYIGTSAVIVLFVIFLLRLIYLAERQRSNFNRIYGWGITSVFFFHFAVNISMTIGLAPVIGIPLPFFSYGGSSLWAFTIMLFIFLRLDSTRKEFLQ